MKEILVQKYGGSSVADPERIKKAAKRVAATRDAGYRVVVVVSAMGDSTDELLSLAGQISSAPPRRELDMLLTVGERISMSLLSMALADLGVPAISFTGSQSGIITNDSHANARIIEVRPFRIQDELERGKVVIVAGYQGVSYRKEITTLGRGGSDTTAVALAAALGASWCEICSDVDGVYSADPRVVGNAILLPEVTHQEMLELSASGAKVLHSSAVEYAEKTGITLFARSSSSNPGIPHSADGTVVRVAGPDTPRRVVGLAARDVCLLSIESLSGLSRIQDLLKLLSSFGAEAGSLRWDGEADSCSALLSMEDLHDINGLKRELSSIFPDVSLRSGLSSVSAVGTGLDADHTLFEAMISVISQEEVRPLYFERASLRMSVVIEFAMAHKLLNSLHSVLLPGADTA